MHGDRRAAEDARIRWAWKGDQQMKNETTTATVHVQMTRKCNKEVKLEMNRVKSKKIIIMKAHEVCFIKVAYKCIKCKPYLEETILENLIVSKETINKLYY